jgi:hypothetical protein
MTLHKAVLIEGYLSRDAPNLQIRDSNATAVSSLVNVQGPTRPRECFGGLKHLTHPATRYTHFDGYKSRQDHFYLLERAAFAVLPCDLR